MLEREASLLLRGEDKGLNQLLNTVTKSSINLNKEILQTGDRFTNLGDSIPHKSLDLFGKSSKTTVGGLAKLDRSLKGVGGNYSSLIDKTEKANQILEGSNNIFVKLGASSLGYGKTLDTISGALGPAAGFWQQYSGATSGAGKALLVAKTAGKGLNPVLSSSSDLALKGADSLKKMGGAAGDLAEPLEAIAKTINNTQKGLKVAAIASDISQVFDKVKTFKDETLPELQEQLSGTLETIDQLGVKNMLFGSSLKTATTAATVLSATTKGLTKDVSSAFLKFTQFLEIKGYMAIVGGAIVEVNHIIDDTYRAVSDFQKLGMDTTFQESALSVGVFGEKLLLSTEAAKKFRLEATGAFIQLQDQLAYLTTLSSAAAKGQDQLGESILNMVDGPLKNSVSALDAATGYYDAISSGQESVDFLNASFKFSAATGASATDSIGALAQVHNIYRINARDSAKTAALFNSTIENGVVNGAQMASGIGQLASTAKSAGIDLVELNAMFAALTKNGFSATDAFQGLMSLITSIAGQGSESAKAAQELGINFNFARIKAEGLMKPINELYSAANGSDSRIKTIVPDALAYRTAIALATGASQDFVDIQGQMDSLDASSLDTVFERRRDSVLQRTQELQRGFNTEMIRFGQGMQDTLEPAIAATEHLLEGFRTLPEPARDLILLATKSGIAVEKLTQTSSVMLGVVKNLGKAFVLARAASFIPLGAGKQRLDGLIDLIKNQKDYTGALQNFLGISDSVSEKIKHLTGIEKSQFLTNQKLLDQRQKSIAELTKGDAIGGLNLFASSEKDAKSSIKKAFVNATPLVKEEADRLRSQIFGQFEDFKDGSNKSNLIIRELGLDKIKDTEQDLAAALERIRAKKEEGFKDKPRADRGGYLERLDLVEDNIQKRQELLSLSRSQLELEREGVISLQNQMTAASTSVKGSLSQGKQIINEAIANKGELLTQIRQVTSTQLDEIDANIRDQMSNMSPQFASVLANKTGAELENALGTIQDNLEIPDPQVDKLKETIDSRKAVVEASKEQIASVREEGRALTAAASGRKLDLIERTNATEAIAKEIAVRDKNIALLQENNKIDFLQLIGDEDIKEKIQAGFATADTEIKEQVEQLAEKLQTSSEQIFNDGKATNIADAIGLGDVQNNLTALEETATKLDEIKGVGQADPEAIALVEENLAQRKELAVVTAAETAALRTQSASLAQQNLAIGANNLAKAQAIGFTGPLAGLNTKLAAAYFAVTQAANTNTAANVANTLSLKASAIATKIAQLAKLGWAGAMNIASTAASKLWKSFGLIGIAVAGLTAAFVAFSKIRGHLKMMEETRESTNKLLHDSEKFKKQLSMASELKSFARELGEYNQEINQALVDAKTTGAGVAEAQADVAALADLNVQSLSKTTDTYDTLNKVGIDGYIDQLDKTSVALVDYNSASNKAFDSVTVNNMVTQSKAAAVGLKKIADNARLAGDNLKAIRFDKLADKAEKFASGGAAIQTQFESSLSKEERKQYEKAQEKLAKERQKLTDSVMKKRGQISDSQAERFEDNTIFFRRDKKKKEIVELNEQNEIYQGLQQISKQVEFENEAIENQIKRSKAGELLSAAFKPDPALIAKKKTELDVLSKNEKAKLKVIKQSETELAKLNKQGIDSTDYKEQEKRDRLVEAERKARIQLQSISADKDAAQSAYDDLITQRDTLGRGEEIIKEAKANKTAAALTTEAFKELQQIEKDSVDEASKITDREIKNKEEDLKLRIENNTITPDEIEGIEAQIQAKRDLNSAREEEYKAQENRLKEAQAALAAMDLNNAALGSKDLILQNNRARAKIVSETLDDSTKATQGYKDFMKAVEQDSNKMLELPEAYKTASLATFDAMNSSMQAGMNATSSYQRRQLAIATNGLAELATNVDIVEEKGLEAARGAVDKAIENVQILQASGALSPEAIATMYDQIENVTAKIGLVGKEGDIKTAAQIDAIFDGKLAAQQEYVNRLVEINRRAIEDIAHLESVALLTDHQAQEERFDLEVKNNDLLYNAASERYRKLTAERGSSTKEALDAYGEMLAAERTLEVSQFQEKRAAETRALELATAKLNLEVEKTILGYSRELDELQLVTSELERQERLISVYNEGLTTSLTFLDELSKLIGSSVKNETTLAQVKEQNNKRNLAILELQQQQEIATQKRQQEQNRLKALELAINNDIAIAEKDREIELAKKNFEQEQNNRQLRDDEIDAFNLKLEQMQRERSLLDTRSKTLLEDYQAEQKISAESLRQLELKQEQARSSGVLDIIGAKLDKITAKYKEQEKVNSAISESFNSRVGYVNQILGAVGSVTTDEKEQQRLAQITAQTKLKTLQRQQELERQTLALQQAQQVSLIQQEKIKLKLLALQQKAAIAEDTGSLIKARNEGDEDTVKALTAVLASRQEILGTIGVSAQSLDQELKTQKQLNRLERENLDFKQKGDRFAAKVEVNQTRPEGRAKDREARRLQKEGLNEVGLSGSALRQQSFRAPTADLPDGLTINLPKGLDVEGIISDSATEFFNRLGIANPLGQNLTLEKEFTKVKEEMLGSGKRKTILDYVDPGTREQFKREFGHRPHGGQPGVTPGFRGGFDGTPTTSKIDPALQPAVVTPQGQIGVSQVVATPSPQTSNGFLEQAKAGDLLAAVKEQLEVQKQLVSELRKQKGDMYNEIAINVADASVGANEIGDIFLNKFDSILAQAESRF